MSRPRSPHTNPPERRGWRPDWRDVPPGSDRARAAERNCMEAGTALDVAPHVGGLDRLVAEGEVVLFGHDGSDRERPPKEAASTFALYCSQAGDGQIGICAGDGEPEFDGGFVGHDGTLSPEELHYGGDGYLSIARSPDPRGCSARSGRLNRRPINGFAWKAPR
jgi:hypothetical protein